MPVHFSVLQLTESTLGSLINSFLYERRFLWYSLGFHTRSIRCY